jgi:Tfp pilus assembly PilM family ATPase
VPDLTTLLNIPVSLVNPLAGMRLADPVRFNPLLADEAPTFLTACGLALRAFDP